MSLIDRFLSLFPPPNMLRLLHSGISITDSGIYVATLRPRGKGLKLQSYGMYPLPEGVVTLGVIQSPQEVSKALIEINKDHGIRFCAATIPDEKAYIFKTTVNRSSVSSISEAVAGKIQEMVPINMQSALFDYTVIDATVDKADVVVRVAHQKVSTAYFEVFKAAGIQPLQFKVESQAIADAILGEDDVAPSIIVHVSDVRTIFAITYKRAVYFSTTLDYGLAAWEASMQRETGLSPADVKKAIRGTAVEGATHEQIIISLANMLSVVRDEVLRIKEYWKSRDEREIPIHSVIISGAPAVLPGLTKYLADSLELPVKQANVWTNAFSVDEYVPKLQYADSLAYAPAVGVALPQALHW
jgi:type IV pilus assembly protein PilM